MAEPTMAEQAKRQAALERAACLQKQLIPAVRPLASVIGMFEGSEFMRQVDAEIAAMREAEQKALDEEFES